MRRQPAAELQSTDHWLGQRVMDRSHESHGPDHSVPFRPPVGEPSSSRAQAPTMFVIDDNIATRELIGDTLRENAYAVELFSDCSTFLRSYREVYGCLIVDVVLPHMDGIGLIERLNKEGHEIPAVVISGAADVSMAVRAFKAGAVDFLEKPFRHDALLASIDRALAHRQASVRLTKTRRAAARQITSLSPRQRQVLDLVLAGHRSKNIAADLGISQRTVDNHRAAIMKKTGSRSLPVLIRTALAAA